MPRPIPHGVITHENNRNTDYLYRISLKCLVVDATGRVLVVKERGRDWWDLPGGGMDHGEDIKNAVAREMSEEVNFTGDFDYRIIDVEEPKHLQNHNFWQIRLIFAVTPKVFDFSAGVDGDEVSFIDPLAFKDSEKSAERLVHYYHSLLVN